MTSPIHVQRQERLGSPSVSQRDSQTDPEQRLQPVVSTVYEDRKKALEAISSAAAEISTVKLSQDRLQDEWNGNAQIPGFFQAIYAPYRLGKYVYQKINLIRCPALETTKPKIVVDMVQILNLAIHTLLSLAFIGVSIGSVAVATPLLLATGFFISLFEIGMETYKLHHFKKFTQEFNANSFKKIDVVKENIKKNSSDITQVKNQLVEIVKQDSSASKELKQELTSAINRQADLAGVAGEIKHIEQKLLVAHFEHLQARYYKLSQKEIGGILDKSNDQFDEKKHIDPLQSLPLDSSHIDPHHTYSSTPSRHIGYDAEVGFKLINKRFEKKQILLARYVQPWLVEQITSSYQNLLSELQKVDPGTENCVIGNAKTMLYAMDESTSKREQLYFTNIIQWMVNICYLVCIAAIPQAMIVGASLFLIALLLGFFNEAVNAWGVNKQDPAVKNVVKRLEGKPQEVIVETIDDNQVLPHLPRPDLFPNADMVS